MSGHPKLVTEARRNTLPSGSCGSRVILFSTIKYMQQNCYGAPSQEAKADRHGQRKER